jgi:hypothetical protein
MINKNLLSKVLNTDDPVITTEAIKEFYNAILDSPELYPCFMALRPNGLWSMCNKMASYFTLILSKDRITPADTEYLKKIHHNMNISEYAYDTFTGKFAHICCRNKSDAWRQKMLSMFSLLKAHICPSASSEKSYKAFVKVISKLHPVSHKEEVHKTISGKWLDSFPEPNVGGFLRSNGVFGRSEVWNEQANFFHLRQRVRKLQKLLTLIKHKSELMETRIAELEAASMNQHGRKPQRDLDLVYI